MTTYYVESNAVLKPEGGLIYRCLKITADRFELDQDTGTYEFFRKGDRVASVPSREIFAVVEEGSCSTLVGPNGSDVVIPVPQTPTAIPDQVNEPKIERWKDITGKRWYGFWTPKGFVYFTYRHDAEEGLQEYIKGSKCWAYLLPYELAKKLED